MVYPGRGTVESGDDGSEDSGFVGDRDSKDEEAVDASRA
jgi:hypothetical protein